MHYILGYLKRRSLPLLPSSSHLFLAQRTSSRRIIKLIGALVAGIVFVVGLWQWAIYNPSIQPILLQLRWLPPTYSSYHQQELALPQHNPELPYPEGRNGRFIYFSNHAWGAGWGNIFQEHLLHGLLAYNAKRAFVFDDYTWSFNKGSYSLYNGKYIPSRIPMSALISGPLAGEPFAVGDSSPRVVVKQYFDEICPNPKIIDGDLLKASLPNDHSALTVMKAWVKLLEETPENCVEINCNIFDIFVFGSERVLDIVPPLLQSPLMTLFRWSPLIIDAFERNAALLVSPDTNIPSPTEDDPYPVIPGLLVLHVRRGDFKRHCHKLNKWGSTWTGFNQLPHVLDRFESQKQNADGSWTEESRAYYQRTCFPSIDQMAEKVYDIRHHSEAGRRLRNIYIMTNGSPGWVSLLKTRLRKTGEWDSVTSSRELSLTWEQIFVKQALDSLIGQRADVFVGNGYSSLTGNIVLFRVVKGLGVSNTRHW